MNGLKQVCLWVFLGLLLFGCGEEPGTEGKDRFQTDQTGIIIDTRTGLHWAPDPGRRMTWHQADEYARQLRLGGFADWRLPTRAELRDLGSGGLDPAFKLAGNCAWSSEREDDSSAWEFHFREGRDYWLFINRHAQVLAVRSRK
jgi:formylglycine-generating enzyme required for sulfatase activity